MAQGKAPLVLKRKGAGTNSVELAFTKWNSLNPSGSRVHQVELSIRWNSFFEFHFHSFGHDSQVIDNDSVWWQLLVMVVMGSAGHCGYNMGGGGG